MSKEWWCPTCKVSPTWENVTFEERHAVCGTLVSGIDEPCPSCATKDSRIKELEEENARLREELEVTVGYAENLQATAMRLREAVEWALKEIAAMVPEGDDADSEYSFGGTYWEWFYRELRRKAGADSLSLSDSVSALRRMSRETMTYDHAGNIYYLPGHCPSCATKDSRIKELEGLVVDTMDFAIEGWSYASEYFKDKWDYEGELERLRGRLHKAGKEG